MNRELKNRVKTSQELFQIITSSPNCDEDKFIMALNNFIESNINKDDLDYSSLIVK